MDAVHHNCPANRNGPEFGLDRKAAFSIPSVIFWLVNTPKKRLGFTRPDYADARSVMHWLDST